MFKKREKFLIIKKIAAKILCHPLVGIFLSKLLKDRLPNNGCKITTIGKLIKPEIKASILWGIYESAEIRFIKQYLRSDFDVVELGSGIGVVTSHIAKKIGMNCRIICVEANKYLFEYIHTNAVQNVPKVNITIVHGAICYFKECNNYVEYLIETNNLKSKIAKQYESMTTIRVPTTTLDKILKDNNVSNYSLVTDIEGAEAGIIEFENNALKRCQCIIIELHDTTLNGLHITVQEMSDKLQKYHGFIQRDRYGNVFVFDRICN